MYVIGVNQGSRGSVPAGSLSGGAYLWSPFADTNGVFGWGCGGLGAINSVHTLGQRAGRYFASLPFGVTALGTPMSSAEYAGRLYLAGGHSYNTVLDEHHRFWKQGMRAPDVVPNITGAAGTTVFAYFSWWDELTSERSPLSQPTEIGSGTPRTWNSLPTRPPDDVYVGNDQAQLHPTAVNGQHGRAISYNSGSRLFTLRPGDRVYAGAVGTPVFGMVAWPDVVEDNGSIPAGAADTKVLTLTRPTHLELWLSIAGDFPRLAMRVPIGVTTVTESKGVADLGEAFFSSFQRFPRCTMNAIYHDRQLMAGDPENPDTLYVSELFYPERFAGKQFRTRDGKPITGIIATRDYALVFTRSSTYQLQGYTDNDLRLNQVDQNLGAVAHNCNTVIHGDPFVWTEKGPYFFNGQWHPLSPENRWKPVPIGSSVAADMVACDDPYFNTYIVSGAAAATERFLSPYNGTYLDPFGAQADLDGTVSVITAQDRGFSVLDYTLVKPEAGGSFAPARLSLDSILTPAAAQPEIMQYLRNNWGMGALYHIGSHDPTMDTADADGQGTPANASFIAISLQVAEDARAMAARYVTSARSKILTHFDMLQELDAYAMESKTFKRFWFHMRARTASPVAGTPGVWTLQVHTAPDPGWWDQRLAKMSTDAPLTPNPFYHARAPLYSLSNLYVVPSVLVGDIVLGPPPDTMSGRGLWVYVEGEGLQFHGFGGEYVGGPDAETYVNTEPA